MRKRVHLLAAAAALCVTATGATAMPMGSGALKSALDATDLVEQTAVYIVEGRRYCFYFNGWHGPGWYRCGFAFRRGLGWGGVYGWQGWDYGPAARRFGHRHGDFRFREGRRDRDGDFRRRDRDGVNVRGSTTTRESTTIRREGSTVRGGDNVRGERSPGQSGGNVSERRGGGEFKGNMQMNANQPSRGQGGAQLRSGGPGGGDGARGGGPGGGGPGGAEGENR